MSETAIPEVESRPQEYVAEVGFDDLGLSPELRRGVADRGYKTPTPVQAKAFKPASEGRDLIVRSKTGTGKTCAFGLPMLQRIANGERSLRGLVLCPTRELAFQVCTELTELAKHKDISVAAIYGGASMKQQEDALAKGASVVVGTPGRILDHLSRGSLKLDTIQTVVLDEADEMLNQGFYEDVTSILDALPKTRQVLLFSATVPDDIERLIQRYTQTPETLLLSGDVYTVEHIHHIRYEVSDAFPKPRHLIYVLEQHNPDNAIIFCNTKDDTELVTAVLNRNGFDAELLNGDLPQKERERVMAKIKRGEVEFMVATDLAARGIDISDLSHVINYSLPEDPAVYLHRVGRTGRIGKKGTAINLTSGKELATLTALEKKYQVVFEQRPVPSPEEAMRLWSERHIREIKEASGSSVYEGFFGLAAHMKHRPDADDLIAFLLKYFFQHHRVERVAALSDKPQREAPKAKSEKPRRERPAKTEEKQAKPERPRREKKPEVPLPEGQAKLWLNLGKEDGLDAAQVTAFLGETIGAEDKVKGLHLRGNYSYVFVQEEDVAAFESLTGKLHKDKAVKLERARRG